MLKIFNRSISKRFFLVILITSAILGTSFSLYYIYTFSKNETNQIKEMIVKEAKAHFDNIIITRRWNAQFGGIYVNQKNGMKPNQYLVNNHKFDSNGNKMIKVNPAWMTRQISTISNSSNSFYYKITSLKPINPINEPDKFEKDALSFFEQNKEEKYYYKLDESLKNFDFMGSLKVEKTCLKCHDYQGYKLGDIRGGVRVSLPTQIYQENINSIKTKENYLYLIVISAFIFVVLIFIYISKLIYKHQNKIEDLNKSLESKVKKRTQELEKLNIQLKTIVKEEVDKSLKQQDIILAQSKHTAMGEMISMLAHQWRQPLTTISMGANNIMADIALDSVDNKILDAELAEIVEQTQILSGTIDQFRDFFIPQKDIDNIVIEDLFEEIYKIINVLLVDNNIEVIKEYKSLKNIKTYSKELIQAILNIIKNAIESLEKENIESKNIFINVEDTRDGVKIKICNNGAIIDISNISKIFDPYFTTKQERNGTGLGLYISQTIIEKHLQGTLDAYNENNCACFEINIPDEIKTVEDES